MLLTLFISATDLKLYRYIAHVEARTKGYQDCGLHCWYMSRIAKHSSNTDIEIILVIVYVTTTNGPSTQGPMNKKVDLDTIGSNTYIYIYVGISG